MTSTIGLTLNMQNATDQVLHRLEHPDLCVRHLCIRQRRAGEEGILAPGGSSLAFVAKREWCPCRFKCWASSLALATRRIRESHFHRGGGHDGNRHDQPRYPSWTYWKSTWQWCGGRLPRTAGMGRTYWDSLIIAAAAKRAGCTSILSEDYEPRPVIPRHACRQSLCGLKHRPQASGRALAELAANDPAFAQLGDLVGGVALLLQHLVVVLAEKGRGAADRGG